MNLSEQLRILMQDEDLTDEKLRDASEGLLPKISDFLNDLETFLIAVAEGEYSTGDTMVSMEYYLNKLTQAD